MFFAWLLIRWALFTPASPLLGLAGVNSAYHGLNKIEFWGSGWGMLSRLFLKKAT
jgi:hypothetical protein